MNSRAGLARMARLGSFTRADQLFADQFEPAADESFVYRKNRKGVPIRVSATERDAFIERFLKARRRAQWVLFFAIFLMIGIGVFLFEDQNSIQAEIFLYAGTGGLTALFLVAWRWAWAEPSRALAEREPMGPALEKSAARSAVLRRTSWGQFAFSGLVAIVGGAWLSTKVDLLSGWNRLWLLVGVLYVGMLALRIWQKWQVENGRG
jgi:hypothetical protein